jgi:hypothetical protein
MAVDTDLLCERFQILLMSSLMDGGYGLAEAQRARATCLLQLHFHWRVLLCLRFGVPLPFLKGCEGHVWTSESLAVALGHHIPHRSMLLVRTAKIAAEFPVPFPGLPHFSAELHKDQGLGLGWRNRSCFHWNLPSPHVDLTWTDSEIRGAEEEVGVGGHARPSWLSLSFNWAGSFPHLSTSHTWQGTAMVPTVLDGPLTWMERKEDTRTVNSLPGAGCGVCGLCARGTGKQTIK